MKAINQKGFSLVELIIVIAIIAILVGIASPIFIKEINKAKRSKDIQLAQNIVTAVSVVNVMELKIPQGTYNEATAGFWTTIGFAEPVKSNQTNQSMVVIVDEAGRVTAITSDSLRIYPEAD